MTALTSEWLLMREPKLTSSVVGLGDSNCVDADIGKNEVKYIHDVMETDL